MVNSDHRQQRLNRSCHSTSPENFADTEFIQFWVYAKGPRSRHLRSARREFRRKLPEFAQIERLIEKSLPQNRHRAIISRAVIP